VAQIRIALLLDLATNYLNSHLIDSMAPKYQWQDPEGRATIIKIIKELVPEWDEGLHMWQLNLVVRILDGEDVLCCTATGDGKSALFAVPIIILQEMA
jgi:ATP-dependent helicase YprA (DUF1998 family)